MRRPPLGLTAAAAAGVAILIGLGVWQVMRLAQTNDQLARIAALQRAVPRPIGPVLAGAGKGDLSYARVSLSCAERRPAQPQVFRYALRDGQVGWRTLAVCLLEDGPFDAIVLDRGLVASLSGRTAPAATPIPTPQAAIGVLRTPGKRSVIEPRPSSTGGVVTVMALDFQTLEQIARAAGSRRPAPYYLAVESETPAVAGVTPAALPQDIPNNHLVYALTWFGLAGVLVWTWAAYVFGRRGGP